MRPILGSASVLKAAGEKSRSVSAQPSQRSVIVTVTLLPWSKWEARVSVSLSQICENENQLTMSGNLLAADRVGVRIASIVATKGQQIR